MANSVEGLKPENVVVVDQFGRILSKSGRDPMIGASDNQKKVQREEEDHLVSRVTELLEPVVGIGKVRATAHVELDFDKVKINEEKFDPQSQVERSIQQKEEQSAKRDSGRRRPRNPLQCGPRHGRRPPRRRHRELQQEGDHHQLRDQQDAVLHGKGPRLHQARLPGGDRGPRHPLGEGSQGRARREAPAPHARKSSRSSGTRWRRRWASVEKRGDQLTVENIAFASTVNPKEEAEAKKQQWIDLGWKFAPTFVWIILGAVVFFMVMLPMLKKLSAALNKPAPLRIHGGEGGEGGEAARARKMTPTKSVAELEAEIEAELNAEGASSAPRRPSARQLIKKRVQESTAQDPETIASLIRSWMLEDSGGR